MSRRRTRRRQPHDPAEAERRRAEREQTNAEAKRMKAMGAEVNRDQRTGEILGAYKPDVVTLMQRADKISQDEVNAVRKLEALIDRANGPSQSSLAVLDRVAGGKQNDHVKGKVDAARALALRQAEMDPLTWALLRQLCDGNLLVSRWRARVAQLTGETNADCQAGIVRQAFRVLAGVEEALARKARQTQDVAA